MENNFRGRLISPMQKAVNHPLLRVLKIFGLRPLLWGIHQFSDCCLEMLHLLKPSSRCGEGLQKLQRLYILCQHDASCGSMSRWSYVSGIEPWKAQQKVTQGAFSTKVCRRPNPTPRRLSPNHCYYHGSACLFVC